MDFEELRAINLLEVNEEGKVYILPTSRYGFTSYPLPNLGECILVSQEQYMGLLSGKYMFNENLTGIIDYVES